MGNLKTHAVTRIFEDIKLVSSIYFLLPCNIQMPNPSVGVDILDQKKLLITTEIRYRSL